MDYTAKGATLSADGVYRYKLWRRWGTGPRKVCTFIMLNPSTADAEQDDPTIRKCVGFAEILGCNALQVVNLFAFRTVDPRILKSSKLNGMDIVGPNNDHYLLGAAKRAAIVVAAWGTNVIAGRGDEVQAMMGDNGIVLSALAVTKNGHPGHPLYIPYSAQLETLL